MVSDAVVAVKVAFEDGDGQCCAPSLISGEVRIHPPNRSQLSCNGIHAASVGHGQTGGARSQLMRGCVAFKARV
jgi:hypothetical protein